MIKEFSPTEGYQVMNNYEESQPTFKYYELPPFHHFKGYKEQHHRLIFVLQGEGIFNCNQYLHQKMQSGSCFLIPKSSDLNGITTTDCKIFELLFDKPLYMEETKINQTFSRIEKHYGHRLPAISLRLPITRFAEYMRACLKDGYMDERFMMLKTHELFMLMVHYYSLEEIAPVFHPIVGKSIDFRDTILRNYTKADSVEDLANLTGMGRTNFDRKFKSEFGISPGRWLLQQTAKHIYHRMSEPNIKVKDLINEFGFASSTHFTRFCRQQFGAPPTHILKRIRRERKD